MTAHKLIELGYVGFEVSSLPDWDRFAGDVLGLGVRAGPRDGTRLLRMDDYDRRFILAEGPADDFAFAGWQTADAVALEAFARHLENKGVAYRWGDDDALALRGVERMLHFNDPNGARHEAYFGPLLGAKAFVSSKVVSPYITGAGGLGHLVFGAAHYDESVRFAREILGMQMSDIIRQKMPSGILLDVSFLHLNERHHSLAFASRAGQKRLHHVMMEVADIDDVGRARDRHVGAGFAIAQEIGRHPNDRMISYYGVTPSGFLIEFGWGGIKIDDADWQVVTYPKFSEWGHRPPASSSPVGAIP